MNSEKILQLARGLLVPVVILFQPFSAFATTLQFSVSIYSHPAESTYQIQGEAIALATFDLTSVPTYRYDLDNGQGYIGAAQIALEDLQMDFAGAHYTMEYGWFSFESDKRPPGLYQDSAVVFGKLNSPLQTIFASFSFLGPSTMLPRADVPTDLGFLDRATKSYASFTPIMIWPSQTWQGDSMSVLEVTEPNCLAMLVGGLGIMGVVARRSSKSCFTG